MTTSVPSLTPMPALTPTPVDTSAATTYTDLNGLAALKQDPTSAKSIDAVAQQVDALFLQMMLKSMRDANMGDGLDGNEVGMYQDMFDKQIALTISQHQDIGIGAMLKRQLANKTSAVPLKAAVDSGGGSTQVSAGSGESDATTAALAQTPAEFVNRVMPAIERAAEELGVDPRGLLAQAALETGWGRRMPQTADGASSLNLFGIKASADWSGARATADTVEFAGGIASQKRTAFRAYGSVEESVADFTKLLKESPRYRDVVAAGSEPQAYIQSIARAGYATDPQYANKLNQILNSGALNAALLPKTAKL